MRLWVARHGQTEWNAENRVCGVTDIDLTDKGVEQARRLSAVLASRSVDVLFTSPLKRALETAAIISDSVGKEWIVDHRLTEQNYGVFEGVSRDSGDFRKAKKQFSDKLAGGEYAWKKLICGKA